MPLTNSQMRDVNSVLHPYTNLVKLRETGATVFERGKGIRVYDDTGKDYIEAMAGLWSTALGWGDERAGRSRRRSDEETFLRPSLRRQEP